MPDFNRILEYKSKVKNNENWISMFSDIEFQCTNKTTKLVFNKKLGKELGFLFPDNKAILSLSTYTPPQSNTDKFLYGLGYYDQNNKVKHFYLQLLPHEVIDLGEFSCQCVNILDR